MIQRSQLTFFWGLLFFLWSIGSMQSQSVIAGTWSNVKIGGGGFVTSIISCPAEQNLFYARTDVGGAYRWEESSKSWTPIMDWVSPAQRALFGVESIAIDPSAPNKLYISAGLSGYGWSGSSFLRSEDYGETFEVFPMDIYIHGNGMGRQTGEKIAVDPNNGDIIYLGTRQDGLLKSTDGGTSWNTLSNLPDTNTPNLNGISFVLLDPTSGDAETPSQTIIIGVSKYEENLYISNDAGQSWAPIADAPTQEDIMPQRATLSSDGNTLYLTYANGAGPHAQSWDGVNEAMNRGAVFKFDRTSGIWTDISPLNLWINPEFSGCYGGLTISSQNSDLLYVSTLNHWNVQQYYSDGSSAWGDRIYRSQNGGEDWEPLFVGQDKMLLDNNGIDWISGHNLHWVGSLALDPFDDSRLFATSGNGIFMSNNIDADQPLMKFMVDGLEETVPMDMVNIPNGPLVSVVADYDGWVHPDIDEFPPGPRHTPHMGTSTGICFSQNNPEYLVRAGSSGSVLYYSEDQGDNWTAFENLPFAGVNGKVAINSTDEQHLVAWIPENEPYRLFVTDNFGGSWSNLWNNSYGSIEGAHPYPDPVNSRKFYVYASGMGVLYDCIYPQAGIPQVSALADVGSGGSPHLAVNPFKEADIWIAMNASGIKRYHNGTLETIDNIKANAIAFGKPLENDTLPTIFVWGKVKETEGVYRSTNMGETWFRINDDEHEFGGLGNAGIILGDPDVFGRVYLSTSGRGIVVGNSGLDTLYLDPDDLTLTEMPDVSEEIQIYPNPVNEKCLITSTHEFSFVEVYDTYGRLIKHARVNDNSFDLDCAELSAGVYWIFIWKHKDHRKVFKKIIKQ